MALTGPIAVARRGQPATRNEFGYPVSAGETVYRGSLVGLTATFTLQRLQTAGCVSFAGIADQTFSNAGSGSASTVKVKANKGTWGLTVPSAVGASVNAAVYATDDNTLTLTNSGSLLQVGTLAGVENGQTFVSLVG